MKQRITIEQLNELTDEQKNRIRGWWYGNNPGLSDMYVVLVKYDDLTRYEGPYLNSGHRNFIEDYYTGEALPMLTIGQMIELLDTFTERRMVIDTVDGEYDVLTPYNENENIREYSTELCDALWEAIKKWMRE